MERANGRTSNERRTLRAHDVEAGRSRTDREHHALERPPAGWKATAKQVWQKMSSDHLSLLSAGVALYALLALFPALFAVVGIYGLIVTPASIAEQVNSLASFAPPDVANIVDTALRSIVESQGGTLSVGAAVGVLVALWSSRKGMEAVMTATNIAYGADQERSFLRRMLVSLGLTLAAVIGFVLVLGVAVAIPIVARAVGIGGALTTAIDAVRWVVLWLLVVLGFAIVYRFAPNRQEAHWHWISYGSATAATLWVVASLLFSVYVQNFGSYGKTYGALGGVVVMLLWFYISSYVLLIGAEIDAALEKQTGPGATAHANGDQPGGRPGRRTVH